MADTLLYDGNDPKEWPNEINDYSSQPAIKPVHLMGCPAKPPFLLTIHVDLKHKRLAFAIDDYPLQPILSPIPLWHSSNNTLDAGVSLTAQLAIRFNRVVRKCSVEYSEKPGTCDDGGCYCSEVCMADASIVQLLSTNDVFKYAHIEVEDLTPAGWPGTVPNKRHVDLAAHNDNERKFCVQLPER